MKEKGTGTLFAGCGGGGVTLVSTIVLVTVWLLKRSVCRRCSNYSGGGGGGDGGYNNVLVTECDCPWHVAAIESQAAAAVTIWARAVILPVWHGAWRSRGRSWRFKGVLYVP